jgi:hypothetical protein
MARFFRVPELQDNFGAAMEVPKDIGLIDGEKAKKSALRRIRVRVSVLEARNPAYCKK